METILGVLKMSDIGLHQAKEIQERAFLEGFFCHDCPYERVTKDCVPYGETHTTYSTAECTVEDPFDCPAVIDAGEVVW